MPELPEVETMRRGIETVTGHTIELLLLEKCAKKPISIKPRFSTLQRRVHQQKITRIDRIGKRLIFELANQQIIVFEPRMTGLVTLAEPPSLEHVRLRFRFKTNHPDLLVWDRRGLSTLTLYQPREFANRFDESRLGPDALTISQQQLMSKLGKRSIPIKVGLLDQKALAGIGNIYASEILFVAKVDPRTACNQLTKQQWSRIYRQVSVILREAIKYEGSSLNDGTFRTALNEPGRYQNHHRVYDRDDELCSRCKRQKIVRIVQAQRSTFFCPR
ncbi:MAG TPA: DNA-formamidopyrimidine glycosylase, partial [Pirellulaceae bacterium]|nr:DNA-formamidopyrimidine glycosylase [Pirellulaceae bacterium]